MLQAGGRFGFNSPERGFQAAGIRNYASDAATVRNALEKTIRKG
jgi:hypothetical protein